MADEIKEEEVPEYVERIINLVRMCSKRKSGKHAVLLVADDASETMAMYSLNASAELVESLIVLSAKYFMETEYMVSEHRVIN